MRITRRPLAGALALLATLTSAAYMPAEAKQAEPQAVIYVSPTGSDDATGTEGSPFATLERARQSVAALTPSMTGDIKVVLRGGTYQLTEPLTLGAADSGSNGHTVSYEAYPDERPVLSGGVQITGWTQEDWVNRNRWKAAVPVGLRTRDLFVNGLRAERSRIGYGLTPTNQSAPVIPAQVQQTSTGYVTNNTAIQQFKNPQQIELVWSGQGANSNAAWMEPRCRVAGISGTTTSTTITMQQPCFGALQPAQKKDQTALLPTYLENVLEATDKPGRWYLDEPADLLYYVPLGGEDVTTAAVVAPELEQLVVLRGTPAQPVHDIAFTGITFAYTTWLGPNSPQGYPEQQATVYTSGSGRSAPRGTVSVVAGRNVTFANNVFTHLGGAGLELGGGTQGATITGNVFSDVAGNGIQVGGFVTRHPAAAAEDRTFTVANNYITRTGAQYRGAVGILAGYVADTTIRHNELTDLPYSGISIGWGWNTDTYIAGNHVEANNIHSVLKASPQLHDGGGIYTLGSSTVGDRSSVSRNWVHDLPYAIGALYLDAGSNRTDVTQNVVSESNARTWFFVSTSRACCENVFRGNYTSHTQYQQQTNTGGNTVADNVVGVTDWPVEAKQVMREAGLEPAYRSLARTPNLVR